MFISGCLLSVFSSPVYNASLYLLGVLDQSKLRLRNAMQTMKVKYGLIYLIYLQQNSNKSNSIQHRSNY